MANNKRRRSGNKADFYDLCRFFEVSWNFGDVFYALTTSHHDDEVFSVA